MHIGIDPGHGGPQPGCQGGGFTEKDLTLKVAQWLRCQLPVNVVTSQSRWGDDSLPLTIRGQKLQACDQVLVVHFDWNADPQVGDLSAYYLEHDDVARIIATEIETVAPAELRPLVPKPQVALPGSWTQHAYNVLKPHEGRHPVLVECAFLSNPRHLAFLRSDFALEGLSLSLALGLLPAMRMWEARQRRDEYPPAAIAEQQDTATQEQPTTTEV